jgi:prepilin-type N-terminal cleavage/methylation domain-containing protein
MIGPKPQSEAGFSLIEMLIAMTVLLVVLAGTSQIMSKAIESEAASTQVLDMNGHLRAAMDLVQRDLLQTGQGLPVGRRIGIPNGPDAEPIIRPGPPETGDCGGVTTFPPGPTLPAVSVGPDLGPEIDGVCTDVITIVAADNLFGKIAVAAIAPNGQSAVFAVAPDPADEDDPAGADISDDPDRDADNLRPGDLLLFEKGNMSVLVQVTAVDGQTVTFDPGDDDPLGLNQFDTDVDNDNLLGTLNRLKEMAPRDNDAPADSDDPGNEIDTASTATRIRLVTYFVDTEGAAVPRLMRTVGGAEPNAVAIGVQGFRLTYDIADQNNNPTSIRMDADDLAGNGACPDDPDTDEVVEACSENQIRKVNVVLSMRAAQLDESSMLRHGNSSQSTLYSQVSLRSLAFVDRYQ